VRYIGYVKEIEDGYRAADFTILASKYEPFGLVGVESAMCGTPVIFPSSIGCCDAIASHAKFVFAPDDLADLRATLERAIRPRLASGATSPTVAAASADVAREAVLYDASVASHVDALLGLATQIVERR
jgi:glycosyltransferase involved in cell wall biosynthesis